MSAYPSTADLAAFRRTYKLADDPGAPGYYSRDIIEPGEPSGSGFHPVAGAWPHEREHGIGYRYSRDDADLAWDAPEPDGGLIQHRREASAMRSRAYARSLEYEGDICARCGMSRAEHWRAPDGDWYCEREQVGTFEQL